MPADMPRLSLNDVTLCCVDTRSTEQALYALRRCLDHAGFGRAVLFGSGEGGRSPQDAQGIELVAIPPLRGIRDYNRFMLRDLAPHIRSSHALVVQWDGYVVSPGLWRADFLEHDYIGSPWYHGGHPGFVGNGGFSLRSKRLLDAVAAMEPDLDTPEDTLICVGLRAELETRFGIRYAPLELARQFGCEYGGWRTAFGFHGMHNFAHVMQPDELRRWLDAAPDGLLATQQARKLLKELMQQRRADEAMRLLRRRARTLGWTPDQLALLLRIWARRWR